MKAPAEAGSESLWPALHNDLDLQAQYTSNNLQ